ncbi:hypothetical protein EAI_05234, partial [Harpegnathos saltator]
LFDANMQNVWFQQDGVGPHFAVRVRKFLNCSFPNQWISRRGSIEWPARSPDLSIEWLARSPDLSPLDFFFWGQIKSKVYATKP